MPRYLTKSRFKLALECVTKLYYTGKKGEYADQRLSDPFLEALAKGGFQVGELAKYYFCEDPVIEGITIDTLDYREALRLTNERLSQPGRVVVAEAAFLFNDLFIRADLVVKENDTIHLYEVKAKSLNAGIEGDYSFLSKRGDKVSAEWESYMYDLAFQKYVLSNCDWGTHFNIMAYLLLVDTQKEATIEGLNQRFKIVKDGERYKVITPAGMTRNDLGSEILRAVNCDGLITKIWNELDVPTDLGTGIKFHAFIDRARDLYLNDERLFVPIGSKCKGCQFKNSGPDDVLKSGFYECWKQHTKYGDDLLSENLVTELWGGLSGSMSHCDNLIKNGIYLLANIREDILQPKNPKGGSGKEGLSAHERRMEQVNRVRQGINESYINKDGLRDAMATWRYPLHMIDFETSMVALPFHKGAKPYQGVAFQFSHHIIDGEGGIEHKGQFLATEPGVFPNYDFVRALKQELENDGGTIFRYHNHENTYLAMIAEQLGYEQNPPEDRDELLAFIKTITRHKVGKGYEHGERSMVDLYELVLRFYYPPYAKGSNCLKKILPSIIHDSEFLRDKYGRSGIYGKNLSVRSLNFDDHVWISEEKGMDPYRTLPAVFEGYEREELDELVRDFEELGDGGAALTAYNYLQFSEVPLEQRRSIGDALLRYCELDTMAMVMLVEGWRKIVEK